MTTEADLNAAGTRLYGDAEALIAVARNIKADRDAVAKTVALDRAAALAAAIRAETVLATLGGPTGGGSGGTVIASEGENFTVPDNTLVRFGVDDDYVEMTFSGAHVCNLPTFGTDIDPAPNQVKVCKIGPF